MLHNKVSVNKNNDMASLSFCRWGSRAPRETPEGEFVNFSVSSVSDTKCMGCEGRVFEAEKMINEFGAFHRQCYKCVDCSIVLTEFAPAFKDKGGRIFCKSCYSHAKKRAKSIGDDEEGILILATSVVDTSVIRADDQDHDQCPRCAGKVFEAEKMRMRSGNYDKAHLNL